MPTAATFDPSVSQLSGFLEQTKETLPQTAKNQPRFSGDFDPSRPRDLFWTAGIMPKYSNQVPAKGHRSTGSNPEDKKIPLFAILLLGIGVCLTVKSFQEKQRVISYLANTQAIGDVVKGLQEPVVNAVSKIVAIQPKYFHAKILQWNLLLLSGTFFTASGSLLTAHHYIKKGWLHTTSTVALCAGTIFGMLGAAFKDPRSMMELVEVTQAVKTCETFIQNYIRS